MPTENQSNLPPIYQEGDPYLGYTTLTPQIINNNPANCDHFFVTMEAGSRELVCQFCTYGGQFRLGVDLDELKDGKPYLKGKRVIFKTVGRS